MTDTPPEILKKQIEIIQSKPEGERLAMQLEMMEYAMNKTKELLRKRHPRFSEREITIEFVKIYYKDDFSVDEMQKIVDRMRAESPR